MTPEIVPNDDLYFFRTDSGAVKIGRAVNVKKRLSSLQTGNHERIWPWVLLKGRGHEEQAWHTAFWPWRLRGEWFQFTPQMMTATVLARCERDWREAFNDE